MVTASVENYNQDSSANKNISGTGLDETHIWVRKSTFDKSAKPENAELLLKEMVDWIENFIANNQTETAKLTIEQKQLYCVYHYAKYLHSGGHRFYLEKTAKRSSKIWSYVLSGLYVTGAIGHASNFRNMVFWATRNFDIFSNNVSIAADDEEMKKLDKMFLDLEEHQPILETLAKWVRSWRNLTILSDDALPDLMLQRKKIA